MTPKPPLRSRSGSEARVLKGAAAETFVAELYERAGWQVHRVKYHKTGNRARPWSQDDVFGVGDIVADRPGWKPRLIQVTDGGSTSARRQKMEATRLTGFDLELWSHRSGEWMIESVHSVAPGLFSEEAALAV